MRVVLYLLFNRIRNNRRKIIPGVNKYLIILMEDSFVKLIVNERVWNRGDIAFCGQNEECHFNYISAVIMIFIHLYFNLVRESVRYYNGGIDDAFDGHCYITVL